MYKYNSCLTLQYKNRQFKSTLENICRQLFNYLQFLYPITRKLFMQIKRWELKIQKNQSNHSPKQYESIDVQFDPPYFLLDSLFKSMKTMMILDLIFRNNK